MLSRDDAQLAERDRALPGLSLVFDAERLAADIAARLNLAAGAASMALRYVRYKPGTSCLVAGTLQVGERRHDLHVTAYRPSDADKRDKARRSATAASPFGPGAIDLSQDCLATFYPNDGTVRALAALATPPARRGLFAAVFDRSPELHDAEPTLLAYKPERRAAVRLDVGGEPAAVLKLHGPDRFAAARQNARSIRRTERLRVARRMGTSGALCAVGLKWVKGKDLLHVLQDGDAAAIAAAMTTTARALADLHRQPIESDGATAAPVAEGVAAVGQLVAHLCPPLAAEARRLADELAEDCAARPSSRSAVHGDFYAKQVLLRKRTAAILDLDDVRAGEAEQDLGNFLGHLDWYVHAGRVNAAVADRVGPILLSEYDRAAAGIDEDRVRAHRAAGLFRLAARPFRDRMDDWPRRIERLLANVADLMTATRGGCVR